MSEPTASSIPPADLQFDRAVTPGTADPSTATVGVKCSQCQRAITQSYFTLSDRPYCGSCKVGVEQVVAGGRRPAAFLKALVFGTGAAIAGAIVYYGVLALLELEIAIVAILIGYMVGYAIRRAVPGGGRRYQILGAALTYLAVGLAYMPIAIKGARDSDKPAASANAKPDSLRDTARVVDSVASRTNPAATRGDSAATAEKGAKRQRSFFVATALLVGFALALPILVVVGSMPSGLISVLIIGLGMRQAWRMTAPANLAFLGPLKVAAPPGPLVQDSSAPQPT
jgi:F0F1-type ATP synthase assembly protein I